MRNDVKTLKLIITVKLREKRCKDVVNKNNVNNYGETLTLRKTLQILQKFKLCKKTVENCENIFFVVKSFISRFTSFPFLTFFLFLLRKTQKMNKNIFFKSKNNNVHMLLGILRIWRGIHAA